jgi:ubiquitin-protein ligase
MDIDEEDQEELANVMEQEYVWRMKELGLFGEADMKDAEGNYRQHYAKNISESATSFNKEKMQRLAQESAMLMESLPISRASSVFVRTDDERIDVMKALITGPQGTPYSQGCFVFDIFFPGTYPNDPPLCNLETTGSGTVRFNPNLYNDGKVCLSLLGTWHGDKDSKWNPAKSNLHQVLVSIQALILVEQPYFNEPSYEAQRGTTEGTMRAAEYV